MEELKQRILADGRAEAEGGVVKVGSFLNHQIDPPQMKQILGYFLGFAIFIVGIPAIMWLAAGMPTAADLPILRLYLGALVAVAGLAVSVWSIWSLLVFAAVAALMMLQVRSEEQRLEADFGQEYLDYKAKVRRFL